MPKEVIDYSNTIIYKIVCNDINIKDTYVGHTTNFVQRKHAHKQGVNNPKYSNYSCKLYKFIRNHGGWNNWSMIIVAFKNCNNNYEACALEHEYYKLLNANLNSIDPLPKEITQKKEKIIEYKYLCDKCDFKNNNKELYNKHIKEHKMFKMPDNLGTKSANNYICELCNFNTCKKSDYNRHLLTLKHKNLTNPDKKNEKSYLCNCGKIYKHRQTLYAHKKSCNYELIHSDISNNLQCQIIENNEDNLDYKAMFLEMVKKNNEFHDIMKKQQEQISELIPKVGNNNNNTNKTINNNQKLNLNVFLNEKCKDAISMKDFVKNIEISLKNLLTTKEKGIGIGINEIINENMNKLSLYERPIHCTDKKRETLYVKNDSWEKDTEKTHTTTLLKGLQSQQIKNMHKWKEENPNYNEDDELKHEYTLLINKCTKPLNDHEKKLFKNLCNNTYLTDEIMNSNKDEI